jgi:hypothetical protein
MLFGRLGPRPLKVPFLAEKAKNRIFAPLIKQAPWGAQQKNGSKDKTTKAW